MQSLESPISLVDDAATNVATAVDALEEDIVLGRLHPRERLIEDDPIRRFRFKRHAARDLRGVQMLDSAGILTASTLFVGDIEGGMGRALIFVTVPDSVNA